MGETFNSLYNGSEKKSPPFTESYLNPQQHRWGVGKPGTLGTSRYPGRARGLHGGEGEGEPEDRQAGGGGGPVQGGGRRRRRERGERGVDHESGPLKKIFGTHFSNF